MHVSMNNKELNENRWNRLKKKKTSFIVFFIFDDGVAHFIIFSIYSNRSDSHIIFKMKINFNIIYRLNILIAIVRNIYLIHSFSLALSLSNFHQSISISTLIWLFHFIHFHRNALKLVKLINFVFLLSLWFRFLFL